MEVVTFEVNGRSFAVDLLAVREVLRLGPVTPVPMAPPSVVGAMNAGGQVVPVLDLGLLLGQPPSTPTPGETGLWVTCGDAQAVLCLGRIQQHPAAARPRVRAVERPADSAFDAAIAQAVDDDLHVIDLAVVFRIVGGQVIDNVRSYQWEAAHEAARAER